MTTEDRELLELAAKAAGIEGCYQEYEDDFCFSCGIIPKGKISGRDWWNPLHDDGDAFRLASQLRMFINFYDAVIESPVTVFGKKDEDKLLATRRAIVEAAAKIARNMP